MSATSKTMHLSVGPELDSVIAELRRDSHPPMAMVECSACHALISWRLHRAWHEGLERTVTIRPIEVRS